jgi:hypothetical protein
MVRADVELFRGLSAYWSGMAAILDAGQADDESEALKTCVAPFEQVLVHLRTVRGHEQRIFEITADIEFSAYFTRRHEVITNDTAAFVHAVGASRRGRARRLLSREGMRGTQRHRRATHVELRSRRPGRGGAHALRDRQPEGPSTLTTRTGDHEGAPRGLGSIGGSGVCRRCRGSGGVAPGGRDAEAMGPRPRRRTACVRAWDPVTC